MQGYTEIDDEEEFTITPERAFSFAGKIRRSNYKREWMGYDYRVMIGKYKGNLVSSLTDEKWLTWALNQWYIEMAFELRRSLIDQFNTLHK